MNRSIEIDAMKGIAIISVMLGHFIASHYGMENFLFRLIYSFHMPLFFILSGYFFKVRSSREIIKNMWNSLLKYYCIFSLIIVICTIIRGGILYL